MQTRVKEQMGRRGQTRRIALSAVFTVIGMVGLLGVSALSARAQDQPPPGDFGGPGGPGGFGGGPGGHRGPGGPGGMRGPRPATLSHAPVEALASALNLTDDQQTKLREMQQAFREKERSGWQNGGFPPRSGGPGGPEGQGGPPSEANRQAFDAQRKAFDAKSRAADQEMAQILTDAQKKALPGVLKSFDALQAAGFPPPVLAELKLTADQRTRLAAVADKYVPKPGDAAQPGQRPDGRNNGGRERRQQANTAVMGILTDSQKKTITKWEAAHPRPQRGQGGPGGFGGPGGPDGAPPPPPGE